MFNLRDLIFSQQSDATHVEMLADSGSESADERSNPKVRSQIPGSKPTNSRSIIKENVNNDESFTAAPTPRLPRKPKVKSEPRERQNHVSTRKRVYRYLTAVPLKNERNTRKMPRVYRLAPDVRTATSSGNRTVSTHSHLPPTIPLLSMPDQLGDISLQNEQRCIGKMLFYQSFYARDYAAAALVLKRISEVDNIEPYDAELFVAMLRRSTNAAELLGSSAVSIREESGRVASHLDTRRAMLRMLVETFLSEGLTESAQGYLKDAMADPAFTGSPELRGVDAVLTVLRAVALAITCFQASNRNSKDRSNSRNSSSQSSNRSGSQSKRKPLRHTKLEPPTLREVCIDPLTFHRSVAVLHASNKELSHSLSDDDDDDDGDDEDDDDGEFEGGNSSNRRHSRLSKNKKKSVGKKSQIGMVSEADKKRLLNQLRTSLSAAVRSHRSASDLHALYVAYLVGTKQRKMALRHINNEFKHSKLVCTKELAALQSRENPSVALPDDVKDAGDSTGDMTLTGPEKVADAPASEGVSASASASASATAIVDAVVDGACGSTDIGAVADIDASGSATAESKATVAAELAVKAAQMTAAAAVAVADLEAATDAYTAAKDALEALGKGKSDAKTMAKATMAAAFKAKLAASATAKAAAGAQKAAEHAARSAKAAAKNAAVAAAKAAKTAALAKVEAVAAAKAAARRSEFDALIPCQPSTLPSISLLQLQLRFLCQFQRFRSSTSTSTNTNSQIHAHQHHQHHQRALLLQTVYRWAKAEPTTPQAFELMLTLYRLGHCGKATIAAFICNWIEASPALPEMLLHSREDPQPFTPTGSVSVNLATENNADMNQRAGAKRRRAAKAKQTSGNSSNSDSDSGTGSDRSKDGANTSREKRRSTSVYIGCSAPADAHKINDVNNRRGDSESKILSTFQKSWLHWSALATLLGPAPTSDHIGSSIVDARQSGTSTGRLAEPGQPADLLSRSQLSDHHTMDSPVAAALTVTSSFSSSSSSSSSPSSAEASLSVQHTITSTQLTQYLPSRPSLNMLGHTGGYEDGSVGVDVDNRTGDLTAVMAERDWWSWSILSPSQLGDLVVGPIPYEASLILLRELPTQLRQSKIEKQHQNQNTDRKASNVSSSSAAGGERGGNRVEGEEGQRCESRSGRYRERDKDRDRDRDTNDSLWRNLGGSELVQATQAAVMKIKKTASKAGGGSVGLLDIPRHSKVVNRVEAANGDVNTVSATSVQSSSTTGVSIGAIAPSGSDLFDDWLSSDDDDNDDDEDEEEEEDEDDEDDDEDEEEEGRLEESGDEDENEGDEKNDDERVGVKRTATDRRMENELWRRIIRMGTVAGCCMDDTTSIEVTPSSLYAAARHGRDNSGAAGNNLDDSDDDEDFAVSSHNNNYRKNTTTSSFSSSTTMAHAPYTSNPRRSSKLANLDAPSTPRLLLPPPESAFRLQKYGFPFPSQICPELWPKSRKSDPSRSGRDRGRKASLNSSSIGISTHQPLTISSGLDYDLCTHPGPLLGPGWLQLVAFQILVRCHIDQGRQDSLFVAKGVQLLLQHAALAEAARLSNFLSLSGPSPSAASNASDSSNAPIRASSATASYGAGTSLRESENESVPPPSLKRGRIDSTSIPESDGGRSGTYLLHAGTDIVTDNNEDDVNITNAIGLAALQCLDYLRIMKVDIIGITSRALVLAVNDTAGNSSCTAAIQEYLLPDYVVDYNSSMDYTEMYQPV